MPIQVIFRNHPETGHLEIRTDRLFERPLIALDRLFEEMSERGQDYFVRYAQEPSKEKRERFEAYIGGEKPLVYWMNAFMEEIERRAREKFSWTFERHCVMRVCDEESECVAVCSSPLWYVSIHDFEKSSVLRHLSLRFCEEWAHPFVFQGTFALSFQSWWEQVDFTKRRKNISRLMDAINEFQRIRNFRLRKMGITLPE